MGTLMISDAIGVDATMSPIYVHHGVSCATRHWSDIAELVQNSSHFKILMGTRFSMGSGEAKLVFHEMF